MTSEEYLKRLAYELRLRKQSEVMVRNTLLEVSSHIAESGETGEAAFGQPKEYAASFPLGGSVSKGTRVGHVAAGVLILMLGTFLVLRGLAGVSFGMMGTLTYFAVALVLTVVLILTGKYLDRRLPDLR
jgi:uncharacterized membrane-anchored protein